VTYNIEVAAADSIIIIYHHQQVNHQVYLLNKKYERTVTVNTMLNKNDKAKAFTVTL